MVDIEAAAARRPPGTPEEPTCRSTAFRAVVAVVPEGMDALLNDPDPDRATRAMQARLQMRRIDLAARQAAADAD